MLRKLFVYGAILAAVYYGYMRLMEFAKETPDIRAQAANAAESKNINENSNPIASAVRRREEEEQVANRADGAPPPENAAP